ncbi:hypothetical protein ACFQI7_26340 [Paenibacillus allorhizosphaerae]|uniref:NIPSNAP domain-containing protein n=1 Tax=Paenibacillus allorhizosphaerae TaxID=2849866 RepID=A0ABM8VM89_9BACL|nr:hypothetical protein [Paenibacillus allorhizosphaerae]CAG7649609.1 hypothetical protein PAECIP111802_04532 [Paenibacillus allorhizosphaerae]
MCIVFVEYKIDAEHREAYVAWMRGMQASYPQVEWYEGTEQPGLFVEIWHGLSGEQYRAMREARRNRDDPQQVWQAWDAMIPWVPGGKDKIHIWQFEKVK